MKDNLFVRSSKLIKCLKNKLFQIGKDNPFYWYYYLKDAGKRVQTKEMADKAVNEFIVDNPEYKILEVISRRFLTHEVCEVAVKNNGLNLEFVPEQYKDADMCMLAVQGEGDALKYAPDCILFGDRGYEICDMAVRKGFGGYALSFVPDRYLQGKVGKSLCRAAVLSNGYSIKYVPDHLITSDLVKLAIETSAPVKDVLLPDGSRSTKGIYYRDYPVLSVVPDKFMSEEMVVLSARLYPESLQYAPKKFVSHNLCLEMIERNPMNLRYVPSPDKELVKFAIETNPLAILAVIEFKICHNALVKGSIVFIKKTFEGLKKKFENNFRTDYAIKKHEPVELAMPVLDRESKQMVSDTDRISSLVNTTNSAEKIYYITDIHLEHQIVNDPEDLEGMPLNKIRHRINDKIVEMLSSVPKDDHATLLIGGDVADSVILEKMFYEQLVSLYGNRGRIIAILGNHELWNSYPMRFESLSKKISSFIWGNFKLNSSHKYLRKIDKIISNYRQFIPKQVILLENELLIFYKDNDIDIMDEQTILNASIKKLSEKFSEAAFLVLGGIGFSGLNPFYNAKMGLYRNTVSPKEDIKRSRRFQAIYEKVLKSAANLRVIVLTHNPVRDWSDDNYKENWIYVSGHTHQNTFLLQRNLAVFSDNQIGYHRKPWSLKSFTTDFHRFDPFKNYPDGIWKITRKQYVDFNRYQGIEMNGKGYPGDVYALKRNGFYMFVLKTKSGLCLLEGWKRHKLNHDINYYFDNLPEYVQKVYSAFASYREAIMAISAEVRSIGGIGTVHGCIVDINYYNHFYLNILDGKVTPYFATDMTNKIVYRNMKKLLKSSKNNFGSVIENRCMLSRYLSKAKKGELPILSQNNIERWEMPAGAQIVTDRSMYKPSHIMRSIQYMFDQKVVRIWDDNIISLENKKDMTDKLTANDKLTDW